ncbi:OLC1v1000380C1 [Oldenlandia corymbosa var. corymbosa]|uniref:OLC1v1000380C1 n=1 Tax=Oldenlandia corymbosa var. corymbosa TaxID=529605 RepID=A0AAV1D3J2_OLDCO|nr:OLC1v1000380C1 [Oldenlandia corymbosa var. corymbosa]
MGKGARNKNQPAQINEASFGTLNNSITGVLEAVKEMSLRLDEISSTVNTVVNNCKNADAASAKSTSAKPITCVDSNRDVVGEFHKLKQTSTVEEYEEKFVKLRDLMVKMNCGLSEGYLISCFLSGLKSGIKHSIANRKPETLYHAFNLARIQEITIKETKGSVMEDKLMKDKLRSSSGGDDPNLQCEQVLVSLNPDSPLKFRALVGEREVKVLISPGIDCSYIDTSLAITAGSKIEEAEPLLVDFLMLGYKAVSRFRCPNFEWMVKGHKFHVEARIVEIKAAYDIVLGADWLNENNPVSFCANGMIYHQKGEEFIILMEETGPYKTKRRRRICYDAEGVYAKEEERGIPLSSFYAGLESIGSYKGMLSKLEEDYLF